MEKKKHSVVRRVLAFMLVVAMCLATFPVTWAAAASKTEGSKNSKEMEKLTEKQIKSLEDSGVLVANTPMEYYKEVSKLVYEEAGDMLSSSQAGEYEYARLLVKGDNDLKFAQYDGFCKAVTDGKGHYAVQFSSSERAKRACEALGKLDGVVYAEADQKVGLFGTEGKPVDAASMDMDGQAGAMSATVHKSWGIGHIGTDEYSAYARGISTRVIKVAVVDTGVDATHPYLEGRVLNGYDFVDDDGDPSDGHYHGTHVAGTIVDCTLGLTNVKILPVRVLDDRGSGYASTVANGIRYAADQGAHVVNLSLGGGHSSYNDDAISYATSKGTLCVVAAGNDNEDTAYSCPAHIEENAVTVAALDDDEEKAYFSNYGNAVDLSAPGVDIVSCVPGGGYRSLSGTSMATPHAAACAALVKLAHSGYAPAQVQGAIKEYCRDLGPAGWDRYYGCGIVDLRLGCEDGNVATVDPSDREVELDLGDNGSKTVNVTVGGNLPARYELRYAVNGSGFDCEWGSWDGGKKNRGLTITATAPGSGVLTVSLEDIGSSSIVASAQINVRVGGVPYPNGGTVKEWGQLESAHDYAENSDYTWIYTNQDASSMTLTFDEKTYVEDGYDYIQVFAGDVTNDEDVLVGRYTGNQLAGQEINVSGQTVKIRLTSDNSIQKYGFKVKKLETSQVNNPRGGTVDNWHYLESTHNYENGIDYLWEYTLPDGTATGMNVTFSAETKVENIFDKIRVCGANDEEIGEYSGMELAGQTIFVPGRTVKVRLTSDQSINYYGFRVSDLEPVISGGSDEETVTDWRDLKSPHPYGDDYDHAWIYAYSGDSSRVDGLSITFDEKTKVESNYDCIYVYVLDDHGDFVRVGQYSGIELAGRTIEVDGSTVKVRLTSDSSVNYWGFGVTDVQPIYGKEKFPESDHNYPDNFDHTWDWTVENASGLEVTFDEQTQVEQGYDYIYVFDGNDAQVGRYTGIELAGRTVRVAGDTVKIRLTSDGSVNYYGFRVTDITAIDSETKIATGSATAASGQFVEVPVVIEKNPGISGGSMDVEYDGGLLTLDSVAKGAVLDGAHFDVTGNVITWYHGQDVTTDGTLFTLRFRVNSNADRCGTAVNTVLHGGSKNLVNEKGEPVEASYESGTVDISGPLLGDVNGDGSRGIGDVVLVLRHVVGSALLDARKERIADVNGDDEVAIGDVVLLNRDVIGAEPLPSEVAGVATKHGSEENGSEEAVGIHVGSAKTQPGGTVSLPVSISKNYRGIAGLSMCVSVPDDYTINSTKSGDLLSKGSFIAEEVSASDDGKKYMVSWYDKEKMNAEEGVLFTLNLTVGVDAGTGQVAVGPDGSKQCIVNEDGDSLNAEFEAGTVTVAGTSVESVALNKGRLDLRVGDKETLTATVGPENATNKNVVWSSSNETVAAVNESGEVTAKKAGTATITVTTEDGGKEATCEVTVANPTPVDQGGNGQGNPAATPTKDNPATTTTQKGTTVAPKAKTTNKPKKVTLKKVSSTKKGTLKLTWKKDGKVTGYQAVVATDKKFKKNKRTATIKKSKTATKTFKKLKRKKTYFAKVRAYKKVGKVKVYGAYSKPKKAKVK